ncbi:MAG: YitT family protein [Pseudomonadota bacterium]
MNWLHDNIIINKKTRNYIKLIFGCLIMAVGYVLFIIPHKIVPGGAYGIAIIIHHIFKLPTGTVGLVINIPLIIWGIKELGPKFGTKTIIGLILTSFLIDFITFFWGNEPLTQDIMLSSIFGGVFIGSGLALVFRAKATTGGSDIVAQIMTKYFNIPVGQNLIIVDTIIVCIGVVAFKDFTLALYSIITIFVTGKVIDVVMTGLNYKKCLFIVSDKHEEIREFILKKINRGGTILAGFGMYEKAEKQIIFTALNRREVVYVEDFVKQVDPDAFIIVIDSREILGAGFRPLVAED